MLISFNNKTFSNFKFNNFYTNQNTNYEWRDPTTIEYNYIKYLIPLILSHESILLLTKILTNSITIHIENKPNCRGKYLINTLLNYSLGSLYKKRILFDKTIPINIYCNYSNGKLLEFDTLDLNKQSQLDLFMHSHKYAFIKFLMEYK
jgi:hypothetical protein